MKTQHVRLKSFLVATIATLIVVAANSPATAADAPTPPAGHWKGAIEIPGTPLDFDIDLAPASDGGWTGDISIPAQRAVDLALKDIAWDEPSLSFIIDGIPGAPTFTGAFDAAANRIAGEFTQGGQKFPFHMDGRDPIAEARAALEGFDELVEKAREGFLAPGIAIGIVKDGEVVYAKGFGKRDIERDLPVTPKTLFAIGSTTKAFTTFLMGTLVDEGKLDLDTPVVEYLPGFQLKDPDRARRVTPRDLVTHRTGLPRHDLIWYNNTDFTLKDVVHQLRYLEANADLRAKWQYNNAMFLVAGHVCETLGGATWEELIRARIFEPLGMTSSNFSVHDSQKADDFAQPYEEEKDVLQRTPFRDIRTVGPAGAINSNLEDMTKWLRVQLGGGKFEGRELLASATLAEAHLPQMAMGSPSDRTDISSPSYGLGWMLDMYRGHRRSHHGGGIDGFTTQVMLFPDDALGIVVFANKSGTGVPTLLAQHAADLILGTEPVDWVGEALERRAKFKEIAEEAEAKKKTAARKEGTSPAHPLADYVGDYAHPGYGTLSVAMDGDHLQFTFNNITTPLEHWHYEVFNALKDETDDAFEDTKLIFVTNLEGDVAELSAPLEPFVANIVFARKPDARQSDPAFLERFVGSYEFAGDAIVFTLRGNVLVGNIAGQPPFELEPYRGMTFRIKDLTGYSVTFHGEETITEAVFNQPNGVFTATRAEE